MPKWGFVLGGWMLEKEWICRAVDVGDVSVEGVGVNVGGEAKGWGVNVGESAAVAIEVGLGNIGVGVNV